ncbi:hypothetical protein JST97_30950 [bacterium]|nr:hypothetical protein [bacterium]
MRRLWVLLFVLLFAGPILARNRTLIVVIPLPQAKFPPEWTQTIHVSLDFEGDSVADHRYFKPGGKEFRAILKGKIPNEVLEVEVMCLSKGEKHISVFRQSVHIKKETRSLKLDHLRFVETINQ